MKFQLSSQSVSGQLTTRMGMKSSHTLLIPGTEQVLCTHQWLNVHQSISLSPQPVIGTENIMGGKSFLLKKSNIETGDEVT